jgi:hypothetical protein
VTADGQCAARGHGCGTPSGWFNRGRCVKCRRAHNRHSRNQRGLGVEQRAFVLGALRAGMSTEQAAAEVGRTARSLQAAAVRDGELRAALDGESLVQQQVARRGDLLLALIRSGGNRDEAAREMGETVLTVGAWSHDDPLYAAAEKAVAEWVAGATGKKSRRHQVTAARLDRAAELLEGGMPLTKVAIAAGVSYPTLVKYRSEHERLDAAWPKWRMRDQ